MDSTISKGVVMSLLESSGKTAGSPSGAAMAKRPNKAATRMETDFIVL